MKLLHDSEDAKAKRKSLKPQVEKRRRERINRSLECLRIMLLQGPQQLGGTQRRVEKAEILEHTVLFLQNTAETDNKIDGGGDGGQKHSFQDGISICLQRAAQFLGPEWKGLWLGADSSFAARFSPSNSGSAGIQRRTEALSSLPHTKSVLQILRQKSKSRKDTQALSGNSFVHPDPIPVEQGFPRLPQPAQKQNQLEIRVERQAGKQSRSQNPPVCQTLWRPWP